MFINEYDSHLSQLTGYLHNIQGIHTLWLHLHHAGKDASHDPLDRPQC